MKLEYNKHVMNDGLSLCKLDIDLNITRTWDISH